MIYNFEYNVSLKTIGHINSIDFTYHINNFDYPIEHQHLDYYELTLVLDGEIINTRNGIKELIAKNQIFVSTPSDVHKINKNGKSNLKLLNIICRKNKFEEIVNFLYPNFLDELNNTKRAYSLNQNILMLVEEKIQFVNSLSKDEAMIADESLKSTVILLLNELYQDFLKQNKPVEKWGTILSILKDDVTNYSINVNQLCEKTGYSRTQLNRIFQEQFNCTPHEYLVKWKMEYAASLIAYTDYSINEICALVGYSNKKQFNENFKNHFGMYPSKYRNK